MLRNLTKKLVLCASLGFMVEVHAADRCGKIKKALMMLGHQQQATGSSKNLASKLQEQDLKLLFGNMQDAYKKGEELKKLQYEVMDLQKLGQLTPEAQARLKVIEESYTKIQAEITSINDAYLTKMHSLYQAEGIPSVLVKGDQGSLVLKLDLKAPPTNKRAYEFYRRVQNRFGLNEVTLSLKDNAETGFAGFFSPSVKRIEMGPNQGFSMLEDYFNSVSKHESRHAMFAHKRTIGDDSIFHTSFYASNKGDLLNADKMYDSFMSTEELYTYSTDFQSLAQILKKDYLTDLNKRSQLLEQISGHHEYFTKIVASTKSVSGELMTSLDELIQQPNRMGSAFINQRPDGHLTFGILDRFKRRAEIPLVGAEEKAQGLLLIQAQKNYNAKLETILVKSLQQQNIDVADLVSRSKINQLTVQEQTLLAQTIQSAQKSSELASETKMVEEKLLPLILNAHENMTQLHTLAKNQEVAGLNLGELLKSISTADNAVMPKMIEDLKDQMFLTAKAVKEDYKGFALNPKK